MPSRYGSGAQLCDTRGIVPMFPRHMFMVIFTTKRLILKEL